MTEHDPVNSPSHYTSHPSGIEHIEITRHMSFNVGNAVKYLWRAGLKDGATDIQDLEKAAWYIADEIAKRKKAAKKKRKEEKKAKEMLAAMIPPLPGLTVYDTTPPIGHVTYTDDLIKGIVVEHHNLKEAPPDPGIVQNLGGWTTNEISEGFKKFAKSVNDITFKMKLNKPRIKGI